MIAIFFGTTDENLPLFGIGVDSFIEVMSGIGIFAMVLRIRQNPDTDRSTFDRIALCITGKSFYILVVGLAVTAVYNIIIDHKPETTLPGLIISIISIAVMWALVAGKCKVGHELDSSPHPSGCQFHVGVNLHVGGVADFQSDLRSDRIWLRGQPGCDWFNLLLVQRGYGSFRESDGDGMWLRR
jgi:hypothetical protein